MSERRTGLDRRGADFLTALVTDELGRRVIAELKASSTPPDQEAAGENGGFLSLAMPDDIAIIKHIQLDQNEPLEATGKVRFELAQSLPEDERKFHYEVIPTGLDGHYLGLIMRQERIEITYRSFGRRLRADSEERFHTRGVANGRGYLSFCSRTEGDLMTLVDVTAGRASICVVYRDAIVDLASLALPPADLSGPERAARFGVDLKTVINFRMAGLLDKGVSLPLSGLLLWGDEVDDSFRAAVGRQFSVPVSEPQINQAFLVETDILDEPDEAEKSSGNGTNRYLAALGLTVK